METLPYLPLKKIVHQLTSQDLVRCSAVCRRWREVFNQDWMWQPHCDPDLVEPLRTIPSVATPAFVTPQVGNSNLLPICDWRLAFMREKHLWKNWKQGKNVLNTLVYGNEEGNILDMDFLTDTHIVVWSTDKIQILDVCAKPAVVKAKTNTSVTIFSHRNCRRSVVGTTMLLVEKHGLVEVYNVDLRSELIQFKRQITLAQSPCALSYRLPKEAFYFYVDAQMSTIKIFDLDTGEVLKEEPYPLSANDNEPVRFHEIKSSSNSDYVAMAFYDNGYKFKYYIYSIKPLTFLSGVVIEVPSLYCSFFGSSDISLLHHWFAFIENGTLTVYNFLTKKVEICIDGAIESPDDSLRALIKYRCYVCDNSFIFLEWCMFKTRLTIFSPFLNTLHVIEHEGGVDIKKVMNRKAMLLESADHDIKTQLWKLPGQVVFNIPPLIENQGTINQSFTRTLIKLRNKLPNHIHTNRFIVYYSW